MKYVKHKRAALLALTLMFLGAIQRSEIGNSVVVEDPQVGLRLTLTATEIRLVTDADGAETIAFQWDARVTLKPEVTIPGADIEWIYLYYGDSSGGFVNQNGQEVERTYPDKSRYNPSVIAKVNGQVVYLTDQLWSLIEPSELPVLPVPSYTPQKTLNQSLNTVLEQLALDNSGLDFGVGAKAKCICGKHTRNCRATKLKTYECSAGAYGCYDEC